MMETLSADQIKRLRNILRHRGSSYEDAEDHVQEAMVRLCEYQGAVRNVEAFVCTTAINEGINAHRHRKRWAMQPLEASLEDPFPQPETAAMATIRLRELTEALDTHSVRMRTAYMAHRAGYEYREIAEQLGMSLRTVEKHVMRGIELMRREVP